jgi:hypothetical protein
MAPYRMEFRRTMLMLDEFIMDHPSEGIAPEKR